MTVSELFNVTTNTTKLEIYDYECLQLIDTLKHGDLEYEDYANIEDKYQYSEVMDIHPTINSIIVYASGCYFNE